MKKSGLLKWFTLIEMLIVMIIIGILAVVLIESYLTISRVALKVEQEKNLSEESLILTQIIQSISDEATIDYNKYWNDLESSNWFTDILYLTWWQRSGTKIFTSGNCLELEWNFVMGNDWNVDQVIQDYTGCSIVLEQNGKSTILNSLWKTVVSKVMFKIIPYHSDEYYFENGWENIINNLHQPAFWMFVHLYAPLYQPTGTNKIDQPLQLFFNLNL